MNKLMKHTHQDFLNALRIVNEYREYNPRFKDVNKNTTLLSANISFKLFNAICTRFVFDMNFPDFKHSKLSELLPEISIKNISEQRGVGNVTLDELRELSFYLKVHLLP